MNDLEPDSRHGQKYYEKELLYSIAVSLKRIADVICRPPPIVAEMTPEQEQEFKKQWDQLSLIHGVIFNKS